MSTNKKIIRSEAELLKLYKEIPESVLSKLVFRRAYTRLRSIEEYEKIPDGDRWSRDNSITSTYLKTLTEVIFEIGIDELIKNLEIDICPMTTSFCRSCPLYTLDGDCNEGAKWVKNEIQREVINII